MNEHLLRPAQGLGMALPNSVSSVTEQDEVRLVTASKKGDQDAFAHASC